MTEESQDGRNVRKDAGSEGGGDSLSLKQTLLQATVTHCTPNVRPLLHRKRNLTVFNISFVWCATCCKANVEAPRRAGSSHRGPFKPKFLPRLSATTA